MPEIDKPFENWFVPARFNWRELSLHWSRQFLGRKKHAFVAPLQTPGTPHQGEMGKPEPKGPTDESNPLPFLALDMFRRLGRRRPADSRRPQAGGVEKERLQFNVDSRPPQAPVLTTNDTIRPSQIHTRLPKGHGQTDVPDGHVFVGIAAGSNWGLAVPLFAAMIDRLMHHGEAIVIRGGSYRMNDKPTD